MTQTKKYSNIFFISFIVSFIQFCFLFMALFGSEYFFETKVLAVSGIICAVWFFLFLYVEIKEKYIFSCFFQKVVIACLAVVLGLWFVRCCWYYGFQELDSMKSFFYGRAHTDTLFHSTIAESFIVNGYPSLLRNGTAYYNYHVLSHFIFSIISRLLNVPCLVVYDSLYPIIFVPLFIYLFQSVVLDIRRFQGLEEKLSFWDFLFIILCCCGFFCLSIMLNAGLWFHFLYLSESTLVSVICLFIGIKIILKLKDVYCFKISVAKVLIIPVLIIILSCAKISTGTIFYLFVCYYLFRKNPLKFKNYILLLFYTIVFFLAYKLFSRTGELAGSVNNAINSSSAAVSSGSKHSLPRLFDYVRAYATPKYYLFHYLFLLLPALICFFVMVKDKFLTKSYFQNQKNIIPETALVISLLSLGPGIALVIVGGSAFFFCIPAFLISCLLLSGMGVINKLENIPLKWKVIIICICMSSCVYPKLAMTDFRWLFFSTIKKTELSLSEYGLKKTCFVRSDVNDMPFYDTMNDVRNLKNRKDYCIYLAEDCKIFEIFASDTDSGVFATYSAERPFYAITGYTGMPVINMYYSDGEKVYRPDGRPIGFSSRKDEKITLDNVSRYAKAAKKSHVVVLTKDSYFIIDCD